MPKRVIASSEEDDLPESSQTTATNTNNHNSNQGSANPSRTGLKLKLNARAGGRASVPPDGAAPPPPYEGAAGAQGALPWQADTSNYNNHGFQGEPQAASNGHHARSGQHTLEQDSEDFGGYDPPSEPRGTRKQQAKREVIVSGSEYNSDQDAEGESEGTGSTSDEKQPPPPQPPMPAPASRRGRGRKGKQASDDEEYYEEDAAGEEDEDEEDEELLMEHRKRQQQQQQGTTRSGRRRTANVILDSEDSDEVVSRKPKRRDRDMKGFVVASGDEDSLDEDADYGSKPSRQQRAAKLSQLNARAKSKSQQQTAGRRGRPTRNSALARPVEEDLDPDAAWGTNGDDTDGKSGAMNLRKRNGNINYAIPTLDPINAAEAANAANGPNKVIKRPKLPLNMTGRQLDRFFGTGGRPGDSSDDENGTPRKRAFNSGVLAGAGQAGGLFAGGAGMNPAGTPNNLGKVGESSLADTDPLLPAQPVNFESVGGMEQHIQQLKEMVSLPLLYPEVFQRFNIAPPRGVLFHGPPGTGKTLLARALAASCSTEGQKISFFMRKGADCLSKWVGEAERQLRLLFDEAKQQQPSIIFFDEIDGLAPVRSSKQEQIHASIVSTLLALMDGMDGRGQVVVIGATNRPDSVDPALRRPGRFDREFYFPLPNKEARRSIIDIHTKGWQPGLSDDFKMQLAQMTKGYGGADMRALCTEAALNAVQRTYPQIYKSNDRLLIKPEHIGVTARDFVLSAKNLIPSTARSTSSVAAPLPKHLQPLLLPALDKAKDVLGKVLPDVRKVNILEEAEYVQDEGGFEHEQIMQDFEKLRVYRPRLLVHGESGMGQSFIGPAVLQHLEGFHVQSLDLGTLVSDSTRSAEAVVVEMFSEAKRHKPSIIYLPNLMLWAHSVSELVKATFKGLLDAMDPSEPILLMAVVDGLLRDVPSDIRSWFGFVKSNRVLIERPAASQRKDYFEETLSNVQKTPKQFPDAVPKKKRKLEILPKAPPPPPRQLTEAELARQAQQDATLREYLKFKLGPLIAELKKRFKRFTKPIGNNYVSPEPQTPLPPQPHPLPVNGENAPAPVEAGQATQPMDVDPPAPPTDATPSAPAAVPTGQVETNEVAQTAQANEGQPQAGQDQAQAQAQLQGPDPAQPAPAPQPAAPKVRFIPVDLDVIHSDIYYDRYLTIEDFLEDLRIIVDNASLDPDPENFSRASAMLNYSIITLDQVADPQFRLDCQRMAARERERRKAAKGKARAAAAEAKAAQAASAQDAATAPSAQPKGEGHSQDASRPNLKRPAEDGDSEAQKRPRTEEASRTVVDPSLAPAPQPPTVVASHAPPHLPGFQPHVARPPMPASPLSNGVVHTRPGSESPTPKSNFIPPRAPTPPRAANQDSEMQPSATSAAAEANEEREPTPEPEPPFILPYEALNGLAFSLQFHTDDLSVDQLEQLRAAMCDSIWRGRKEWDRTGLVEELREMVDEFVQECRDAKAQDRFEEED